MIEKNKFRNGVPHLTIDKSSPYALYPPYELKGITGRRFKNLEDYTHQSLDNSISGSFQKPSTISLVIKTGKKVDYDTNAQRKHMIVTPFR